ncbi:MAG: hypothetical protein RSC08_05470, partial [Oscillospiraceae bacterium]
IALKANGTVWMWGRINLRAGGSVGTSSTASNESPRYVVTYEYPQQVTFEGLSEGEYIVDIDAYGMTFIALSSTGNVYTWGNNDYGQLGNGTWNYYVNRYLGSNSYDIIQKSFDTLTAKRVLVDGKADAPAFGIGGKYGPAMSVTVGDGFAAAATNQGYVYTWGINDFGQMGINTVSSWSYVWQPGGYVKTPNNMVYTTPQLVHGMEDLPNSHLANVAKVAAGSKHLLALRTDGLVFAWGDNTQGQLGDNWGRDDVTNPDKTKITQRRYPVLVRSGEYDTEAYYLRNVTRMEAGDKHTVLMTREGKVVTFGGNQYGQLGSGEGVNVLRPLPLVVDFGKGEDGVSPVLIRDIGSAANHLMALSTENKLYAWGNNAYGQLGNNRRGADTADVRSADANKPQLVLKGDNEQTVLGSSDGTSFRNAAAFTGGDDFTVIAREDGQLYIMGDYNWGKYDYDSGDPVIRRDTIVPDRFGNEETKLYVWAKKDASGNYTKQPSYINLQYAVQPDALTAAAMKTPADDDLIPVTTKNTQEILLKDLYQDFYFAYSIRFTAYRMDFEAGSETYLVLDSSDVSVATAEVVGDKIVVTSHGVGTANISVYNSKTGYSAMFSVRVTEVSQAVRAPKPNDAPAFTGIQAAVAVPMVATSVDYTIALKANGTVWVWGGLGANSNYSGTYVSVAPVQVSGITGNAIQVAAGYEHAVILTDVGTVYAVGYNTQGQLGNGVYDYRDYNGWHVTISNTNAIRCGSLSNIGAVAAGGSFSAAVDKTTGEVYVWGVNLLTEQRDTASHSSALSTRLVSPTKLNAGFSASHTGVVHGSVGFEQNEALTNIISISASHTALMMLRQDGEVFVVGQGNTLVPHDNGYNETGSFNYLLGQGYGTDLYVTKSYNAYNVAAGKLADANS